jgi:hypothetical protein
VVVPCWCCVLIQIAIRRNVSLLSKNGKLLYGKCNDNQVKNGTLVTCIKNIHTLCDGGSKVPSAVAKILCSV